MPVELPIVVVEHHNTRTNPNINEPPQMGWKLSYVNYGMFQFSIHNMDQRPGFTRLVTQAAWSVSWPLLSLYSKDFNDLRTRDFFIDSEYLWEYVKNIITEEAFNMAVATARALVADGELPAQLDGTPFELCETDGLPLILHVGGQADGHTECVFCLEFAPTPLMETREVVRYVRYAGYEEVLIGLCRNCLVNGETIPDVLDALFCVHCGRLAEEGAYAIENFNNRRDTSVCGLCQGSLQFCEDGEHYVTDEFLDDDDRCNDCATNSTNPGRFIREWNYRPNLEFHPEVPTDPLHPLYIGIELEMSWPDYRSYEAEAASGWLKMLSEDYEDLIYVKSDSSVSDGFEVVTHPMEPQWALDNFPFHVFQEAIEMGASPTDSSTGTHIHIDKASLTTAQLWKMLQVHHKLKEFCGTIGGRGTGATYANWGNIGYIDRNMLQIAKEKGRAFGDAERYVPVNVRNEHTIELRYMAGGIEPTTIRKNIEWVQALYDFTNYISVQDIKQGVLKNQGYLLGWVMKGDYPTLAEFVSDKVLIPTAMPERTL